MELNDVPTEALLDMLIIGLTDRLGRLPTEAEVGLFIFGTKDDRETVLNGVNHAGHEH